MFEWGRVQKLGTARAGRNPRLRLGLVNARGYGAAEVAARAVASLFLPLALAAQGCGGSNGADELITSGGDYSIEGAAIIEHARVPPDLPEWVIAGSPEVRIGRLEGEGPSLFGRIAGVVTTSSGHVIVADSRALELRAFDGEGTFLWRAGGEGEGPGEFRTIAKLLLLPGDSLLVEEIAPRAILFDPLGRHVRTWSVRSSDPERTGRASYHGVLSSGVIVATIRTRDGSVIRRDHRRILYALTYMAPDGSVLLRGPKFFGKVLYSERMMLPQPSGPVAAVVLRSSEIASEAVYAVSSERVAVGVQGRAEILVYDPDADPVMVLTLPSRGTATDRERFVEALVEAAEASSERTVRQQAERKALRLPDTLPGHGEIMFDSEGRLWVEEYIPMYEERHPDWWIFSSAGDFVARTRFPPRFVPHDIRADHVIGVFHDDLDVPYVERRRISR